MKKKSDKAFNLRIPTELYESFKEKCEEDGVSVATAIKQFMRDGNDSWKCVTKFFAPTQVELDFKWKNSIKICGQSPYITGVFSTRGDNRNGQVYIKESNTTFDLSYFDEWRYRC
jgi:hypothetical protein